MAHLRDIGGIGDAADIGKAGCGGFSRQSGNRRLELGHDREAVALAQRHEADGDRNLTVHGRREEGEQGLGELDVVRRRDGADEEDAIGAIADLFQRRFDEPD